jgi:5'-nucleotidase
MKKVFLCLTLMLLLGRVYSQNDISCDLSSDSISLLIVHTNDTHSCIEPISPNYADTIQANKAGFLRRIVLVDSLRSCNSNMLLFDCGDFSQGSPYYNIFKGEAEIDLMNIMKYDACAIGNHEFDFGLGNMVKLFKKAKFPILCCNYDFSETLLSEYVKQYTIIIRNGVKIGVVGVSPQLEGLVSKENFEGVGYLDPINSVNKVAEHLKLDMRCDLVICLSHLGWGTKGIDDKLLIKSTRHIDIVLGGHTHTYFDKPECLVNVDGAPVYYSQMGKNARYVGWMNLLFEKIRK